jgi:RNA 3'-terminal phosphate cyclase (ATP)
MLEIDGSFGEGGGQILRSALSLSVITGQPFKLTHIRKNRSPPGLQPQHLMATHALAQVCHGTIDGAELHAQSISFHPGKIEGGDYFFDIGTAGSVILVMQTILPVLLFASKQSVITVIGGTHVPNSPSIDYFERIFLPAIHRFGAQADIFLERPGYYPKGGGEVVLVVAPSSLNGCTTWTQDGRRHAIIRSSRLPKHVMEREKGILNEAGFNEIETYDEHTFSPGNSLTIWQDFRGVSVLGERGKPAEQVAEEALKLFFLETAEVDLHLADQLVLYAALASGATRYKTSARTHHLLTHVEVVSKFLQRKISLENSTISL